MKMDYPLLSICIPTKNRQKYCQWAIKTILENDRNDFELIIQDNSDDNSLDKFIKLIDDDRLKYFYTRDKLSSTENMNLSIEKSNGQFISMIGDDDTVLPSIFSCVDFMVKNDIDSLCPSYIPAYNWPNSNLESDGVLKIVKPRNKLKETINVENRLNLLFESGLIDYQKYNLPRVYHGVIRKNIFDKIKHEVGCYFNGLSPDIYSTVVLSILVEKHLVLNKPISIAGSCPKSTTSQNKVGGHRGELQDAPHLKNRENYIWDDLIPKFYSVETIWAESGAKAARDFNRLDLIEKFSKKKFNIVSLARSRSIKDIIFRELKVYSSFRKKVLSMQCTTYTLVNFFDRVYQKLFIKKTKIFKDISDISIALRIFKE